MNEGKRKDRLGEVITFYSFKGGVGRSRALANVAVQLARAKHKVLCVDFDLEAPGLESYFGTPDDGDSDQPGLIDLLYDYRDFVMLRNPFRKLPDWASFKTEKYVLDSQTGMHLGIHFLGPGRQCNDYGRRVTDFDWARFYDDWYGGSFLERIRAEMREKYDYVLVDSRTAFSDVGGICTIQLPTVLVLVFSPFSQSLLGIERILQSIREGHRSIRGNQEDLIMLPLPGRVDFDEETGMFEEWFEALLKTDVIKLLDKLVPPTEIRALLEQISVRYVTRYSFRDELESIRDSNTNINSNAFKYARLIQLIYEAVSARDKEVRVHESGTSVREPGMSRLADFAESLQTRYDKRPDSALDAENPYRLILNADSTAVPFRFDLTRRMPKREPK